MNDYRGRKLLPLAAWGLTSLISLAIVGNAFFGQPDMGRSMAAASADVPEGMARLEVDAPVSGGRTIQLKYDPVVETVQRELAAAGYYKGIVDGVIGRKTRQAITSYQAAAGLEADGKPSADLADHIRFTREVAEASLFTGTIQADPDAEARASIRRVQTGLAELAYSPGAINGELTRQTRNAILAFQRDRKMPETGEINEALMAELGKMSGQSELATQ
ncbi:peptidoglycan-binding protein [Aestuariivirga sp.]|uniref:peptidoglycan-binding domain-containing protein n=1 Tax=Aestuariivirga sp. TaxID=2650926 RepID=UPI003592F814